MNKIIEYEDAPSGSIKLYNYKEPLIECDEGYGFMGVLALDAKKDLIQCHICGKWYGCLQNHIKAKHGFNPSEYKGMFGLLQGTALVNEEIREKLSSLAKDRLKVYQKNFQKNRYVVTKKTKNKIRKTLKENRMEWRNLRGTCPAQLIDRLKKLAYELGRTPAQDEVPFDETLRKVYGSYKNACEIAGLRIRKSGETINHRYKYNLGQCINFVREFILKNKKYPRFSDCTDKTMWTSIKRYGATKVFSEASISQGYVHLKENHKVRYDKNSLIKALLDFKQQNGREPMTTDIKRKLLPSHYVFEKYFGSWTKAKEEVFKTIEV